MSFEILPEERPVNPLARAWRVLQLVIGLWLLRREKKGLNDG